MTTTSQQVAEATSTSAKRSTNIKTPHKTPSTNELDWDLSIISYLEAGVNPAKIAAKLGIPKQTLQYHLTKLKQQGLIRKVGYGTWEIVDQPESAEKEVRTMTLCDFGEATP